MQNDQLRPVVADRLPTPVVADGLPTPMGPYSPGVIFDRLVFVSGQGAVDPATLSQALPL